MSHKILDSNQQRMYSNDRYDYSMKETRETPKDQSPAFIDLSKRMFNKNHGEIGYHPYQLQLESGVIGSPWANNGTIVLIIFSSTPWFSDVYEVRWEKKVFQLCKERQIFTKLYLYW